MTLKTKLALLSAVSVAAAVIVVSLVAYFAVRDQLRSQVDETLLTRGVAAGDLRGLMGPGGGGPSDGEEAPNLGPRDTFFQVIDSTGAVIGTPSGQAQQIPVTAADIAVAKGERGALYHDVTGDGTHLRVLTRPSRTGQAVQVARSLEGVDQSLADLRTVLLIVSGVGVAVAAAFGLVVAQRSLRPVARLTAAAEHVAATQELDTEIDVWRKDEVGRLAASFNTMLRALRESRQQQQQLVSDASHELRTPLTSLRTNIEVLASADGMAEDERKALLRDVTFELEELTTVVTELVELAQDRRVEAQTFADVRLDELAAAVVQRAARRSGLRITLDAQPTLVEGNYGLLERAAWNLLDNAAKWSPEGESIEVRVAGGRLQVRDHGPGIPEADRPHVFDGFYRAEAARGRPGSGLGLAIVRQIVEAHGGRAWVEAAPGGGTIAAFELPAVAFDAAPGPAAPSAPGAEQAPAPGRPDPAPG